MATATAPALRIGFVGFGEAAFHISKGLRQAGVASIVAFDIRVTDQVRQRAREAETHLIGTNQELAESCDVMLSAVTADQALNAARQNAPYLSAHHIYADLNSVSPGVKQSVARVIEGTGAEAAGARFAEIAMMAPVPPYGHKVPMLAGGAGAPEFIDRLAPFGISAEIVSREVGTASATKMFRSIMVKGMEALITECVLGATPYHADERVFASLAETFPGIDWKKLADYMLGRVVLHGERRAREMEEVAATLRETGVEPIMADAIVRRMDWSVEAGLKELFGGEAPKSYRDVVDAVSKKPVGAH
jgi:3-hydroxyisobutyrate dehydrogenase-like beta-hydroxyacid dehydrogenase